MSNQKNGKFKMKFSLATNFDRELIENISEMDKDKSIKTVFGKLKTDMVGGGRASMLLPELSMEYLKDYIDLCHEKGLEFNYLLNPMCLSNKELIKSSREEMIKFIGGIVDLGVDWLTVNSPNLCKIIKREFPNVKISVGVHAGVWEIQHIKHWENIGVDEITLQSFSGRNFPLLESMLRYTKDSGIALRVFGNLFCLHNCSYRFSHSTGQSHASRSEGTESYLDNHVMTCTFDKVKNPVNIMASEWIRPEDVHYYEELCEKTGNYNFSIKLVERTKSTEFLTRVAEAYLTRNYDGNLLDLMLWPSVKSLAVKSEVAATSENSSKEEAANKTKDVMSIFGEFYSIPDIYVDNKKLDGFMDKFITNFDCTKKVCEGLESKCSKSRDVSDSSVMCSYCKNWTEKAISYEQEDKDEWVDKANDILESISDGTILR